MESWIEALILLLTLIRDNKHIINYGELNNKLVKDSYEKETKIIFSFFSLKGIISIKETRDLILR